MVWKNGDRRRRICFVSGTLVRSVRQLRMLLTDKYLRLRYVYMCLYAWLWAFFEIFDTDG
jgi:hypothetical protein